jgi:hypothetical protein
MKKKVVTVSRLNQFLKHNTYKGNGYLSNLKDKSEELLLRLAEYGIRVNPKQAMSLRKWNHGLMKWKRDIDSGDVYEKNGTFYRVNKLDHTAHPTASNEDGIMNALHEFHSQTDINYNIDSKDNSIKLYSKEFSKWIPVKED